MSDLFRLYAPGECGQDGYPPEWHATIKHAVREQAGHRCVRCGHAYEKGDGEWSHCDERCTHSGEVRTPRIEVQGDDWIMCWDLLYEPDVPALIAEGAEVEARWRILTVHHLDLDKANCRWWNLASLCQRCHLTIQGRVQLHRVWPWPHSEWFKPYAAGWYAHAYLGEDLARDQVMERLDELLALELA